MRRNDIRNAPTGVLLLSGNDNVIQDNDISERDRTGSSCRASASTSRCAPSSATSCRSTATRSSNQIKASADDGIRVLGDGVDGTRIGVNTGSGGSDEGDLFIDLVGENGPGNGPNGPNGGIEAPSALVATTAGVTVTAEPNATVYVYRRDGSGPRLDAFLGLADADGSGKAVVPLDPRSRHAGRGDPGDGGRHLGAAAGRRAGSPRGRGRDGGGRRRGRHPAAHQRPSSTAARPAADAARRDRRRRRRPSTRPRPGATSTASCCAAPRAAARPRSPRARRRSAGSRRSRRAR